jgi:D-alanyl-D-alanine carboxypeptidase
MWYSYLMKKNKLHSFLLILIIIGLGTIGYFGYQNYLLKKNKLSLEGELSQTKADFASTKKNLEALAESIQQEFAKTKKDLETVINSLQQELAKTKTERDDFELKYSEEKNRMDSLSSQIEGIQGTVGILEKLSQTDEELLKKYSKVYFLNDNYIPRAFIKITPEYTFDSQKDYLIYDKIWHFLQEMLIAAENANIHIRIISAYRSFGTQTGLKSSYMMIYGSGANTFSADQGYSEHQLGTTLDFTTSEIGASYLIFDKTTAYQWLLENAYKYGFIISYPEGNKYYKFEPWHWRFVGRTFAEKLHQEGKNFYDFDQREIDQYLISFFD